MSYFLIEYHPYWFNCIKVMSTTSCTKQDAVHKKAILNVWISPLWELFVPEKFAWEKFTFKQIYLPISVKIMFVCTSLPCITEFPFYFCLMREVWENFYPQLLNHFISCHSQPEVNHLRILWFDNFLPARCPFARVPTISDTLWLATNLQLAKQVMIISKYLKLF